MSFNKESVVKMFDEIENDNLEGLNDWFDGFWVKRREDENKNIWVKRLECFFV
ncbi:hypothetical protein HanRHA438_Chr03g0115101 [Helianthus annuus]|nr:hypothetical protein HanRHA438_Chr03g0115101 [Helianthus annuus]